jgi:hypothetical protein
VPLVLVAPAAVLVLVALATWRLERRLAGDVARLAGTADRLASLRAAVDALGEQIEDSGERRERLDRR